MKKIIFLYGGPGSEHDVSLATAERAMPAFKSIFQILPVFIDKKSLWHVAEDYTTPPQAWDVAKKTQTQPGQMAEMALDVIEDKKPDVIFIGLHGTFGEDGTVQALLEARGISFTGSDAEASSFAMDKPRVLARLQNEDIVVPEFLELTSDVSENDIKEFIDYIGLPVVVLPCDSGSSVGVSIVRKIKDLSQAIAKARTESSRVLITKYIAGREVSAGMVVTGPNQLSALPPTELIPQKNHDFFDYEAKYTPGHTKEVTPPDMSESVITDIQSLARRVHTILGADGYSRTDMIVGNDGKIYILELNTLPGMTATSIIPQQAKHAGMSYSDLLETICTYPAMTDHDFITALMDTDLSNQNQTG